MRISFGKRAVMALGFIVLITHHAEAQGPRQPSVPDPCIVTIPDWVYVVGTINFGSDPDPFGMGLVTVRDCNSSPIAGATVTIDFSECCDIQLCAAIINGQTVNCPAKMIQGLTNGAGEFRYVALGAAADPGNRVPPDQYGGAGGNAVQFRANGGTGDVILGRRTAACLDQNGAAGGSNGTTGGDVSNLANLLGSILLGAPYRGRGDLNADGSITAGDVAALAAHAGRLALRFAVGCPDHRGGYCSAQVCP